MPITALPVINTCKIVNLRHSDFDIQTAQRKLSVARSVLLLHVLDCVPFTLYVTGLTRRPNAYRSLAYDQHLQHQRPQLAQCRLCFWQCSPLATSMQLDVALIPIAILQMNIICYW